MNDEDEPVIPSAGDPRPPRRRVLEQLQRMARAAALGGAALGLAATEAGCIVCDPLPPPMTCDPLSHDRLLSEVSLGAAWAPPDGGARLVQLRLTNRGAQGAFSNPVTVSGAELQGVTTTAQAMEILLVPHAGTVRVQLTYDCRGARTAIELSLDLSGTDGGAAPIPVNLVTP